MKNQIIFSILSIMLWIGSLQAQVTQEWVARYNGPGNNYDEAKSIAVDDSGNVYVTGRNYSIAGPNWPTIKYNSAGVQQWIQIYPGGGGSSIAVDGSGNVYVTGTRAGPDYVTIKYNASGVQQWVQSYNGPGDNTDIASSLAVDDSGNVYVTGVSVGIGTAGDYATIKYNSAGVQQWIQRYNGPGSNYDDAQSLAVEGSGNVYVTGISTNGIGTYDYATIKYNSAGVQQWIQIYNGPVNSNDQAHSLAIDGKGNVYVTGSSTGSGTGSDYATIKYNSSGVQQWVQRYNGPGNGFDYAYSLAVDNSGNAYITGASIGIGVFYHDYATIKYNSSGIQQWVMRYTGGVANSLAVDGSGNVYVTGGIFVDETTSDYATIKYNPEGVQQWVQRYNGPGIGNDFANSLAVDGLGSVYVTGGSVGSGTGSDYATIKYSQLTGIKQTSNTIPEKFSLSQNYPNPFNPNTVISYTIGTSQLAVNSFASLKVYDVLGNEVTTLVHEKQNAGTYEVDFDGSNFPSGVYFYRLLVEGNTIDTKRMVLLK